MGLELISIKFKNSTSFAAVDEETRLLNLPFTQFVGWLLLGISKTGGNTRGIKPTSKTIRQYAYRLKRLFDFISDWNVSAEAQHQLSWNTARKKHLDYFLSTLNHLNPNTRNGLRVVWAIFYDHFCTYMGYSHLMTGLTEEAPIGYRQCFAASGVRSRKDSPQKVIIREKAMEKLTFRVASLEDIGMLCRKFDDEVYDHLSYFMFTTGLRIGGALQVPYPGTDKNNPYITSPELLKIDKNVTDMFPFYYVNKGHEVINDLEDCDVPLYAWEDIWNKYRPLVLDDNGRLKLWRERMVKITGDESFEKRFPQSFWLDKAGREITCDDVWKAFRRCRKKIREENPTFPNIVPHVLRHSYCTWMVICFAEAQNIPLDANDKSALETIHAYLQDQVGHSQRATTMKYIRTATRIVKKRWLPRIMPRRLPDGTIAPGMSLEQITAFNRVISFDGFMQSLEGELKNR